jgi:competence protein ComEC
VELRVLHPSTPDWERQRVRNDDSLVIDVRYGDVAMLLTGDIGREVERQIAGAIEPAALRLVKVPHHGSLTSSSAELLDAIRPAAAFVSAGRGNRFGHPAPAVLDRYRRAGVEMFRTDRDGAITIETDGNQVEISTWTGRHLRLRAPRTFQR